MDLLRREDMLRVKLPALAQLDVATAAQAGDDELALMVLCCHPELPVTSQVVLTLRTVGGLGVNEIAAALLAQPATVAQRLTRAKRWLRSRTDPLELPDAGTMESRVDSVLAVLYLLFNEGYDATTGDIAVRGELCGEAIRLARLLLGDRRTDLPKARALLALMLLQASRLPARVDARGEVLLLDEQDRSRWDRALIAEGTRTFAAACIGMQMSVYHVEAAVALCHAATDDDVETDWPRILSLYDEYVDARQPSKLGSTQSSPHRARPRSLTPHRTMPLSWARNLDVDLRWVVMELAVIGSAFSEHPGR